MGVYLQNKKRLGLIRYNTTENPAEDTTSVTAKVVKPRVKSVRESYMMSERKPTRNVLTVASNYQKEHTYNLSIKTHGNIAVKALFTECSSFVREIYLSPYLKENTIRSRTQGRYKELMFCEREDNASFLFRRFCYMFMIV